MASASRSNKRLLFGFALVVVLAAAGAATYLYKDSRAKETPTKGAGKPPASVPVMVAAVNQQTLPVRVLAIGNAHEEGTIGADNLNPQKAAILLAFAMARDMDNAGIQSIFDTY